MLIWGIVVFFMGIMVGSVIVTLWRINRVPKEDWLDILEVSNTIKDDKLRQLIVQKAVGMPTADDDDDDDDIYYIS